MSKTTNTYPTIPGTELIDFMNTTRGTVFLIGGNGGLSRIVGEVRPQENEPDIVLIETEHGTLHLDTEFPIRLVATTVTDTEDVDER